MSCLQNSTSVTDGNSTGIDASGIGLVSSEKTVNASKRILVTANFKEAVSDFSISDILATGASVEGLSGSGSSYTFYLVPYTTNVSVQILSGSVTFSSETNSASRTLSFVSTAKYAAAFGGCYYPNHFRKKYLPLGF